MRHVLLLLVATFTWGSVLAQPSEPAKPGADSARPAEKPAEKPAAPQRLIEISRSSKTNCDVKPVMTDDELARCRKAWSR